MESYSKNMDKLTSPSPIGIHIVSFSCLVALGNTLNAIMNKSRANGPTCRVSDFDGNAMTASSFNICSLASF